MTSNAGGAALTAGLVLAFVVYGFGRNLGHNVFQALVADRFAGSARSRALTLYEVATMLGLVAARAASARCCATTRRRSSSPRRRSR